MCLQKTGRQGPFSGLWPSERNGKMGVSYLCTCIKEINQILCSRGNTCRVSSICKQGEVEKKALWCIYLSPGSLTNDTFWKFKVSVILSTVNFFFFLSPIHFWIEVKEKKHKGIYPSAVWTKLIADFMRYKAPMNETFNCLSHICRVPGSHCYFLGK